MVLVKGDKLIAETTLTREQAALKAWCVQLGALVDFTSDTTNEGIKSHEQKRN